MKRIPDIPVILCHYEKYNYEILKTNNCFACLGVLLTYAV